MLEDELFLIVGFQDDLIFIKRPDSARKFNPAEQINGHLRLVLARGVQKRVLNVLCRLVFHLPISPMELLCFHAPGTQVTAYKTAV